MNKPTVHIVHQPTGFLLCEDGVFRPGITFIYRGNDTLMYRSIGWALKRLNCIKPGKRIRADMLDECALDIVEANYGTTGKTYRMDHRGKRIVTFTHPI